MGTEKREAFAHISFIFVELKNLIELENLLMSWEWILIDFPGPIGFYALTSYDNIRKSYMELEFPNKRGVKMKFQPWMHDLSTTSKAAS